MEDTLLDSKRPITLPFLAALTILVGVSLSLGHTHIQPGAGILMCVLYGAAIWLLLHISCTFLQVRLPAKEGARLLCLASVPLLIRWAAALVFTARTGLSPFFVTLSPTLISQTVPPWMTRLDLFELWTLYLFWRLVSKRQDVSRKKSIVLCFIMWSSAVALAHLLWNIPGASRP
jgi:hypothetical protein